MLNLSNGVCDVISILENYYIIDVLVILPNIYTKAEVVQIKEGSVYNGLMYASQSGS